MGKIALAVDRLIFIVINYPIIKITVESIAMFTTARRLEKAIFVFTMRTEVRLGGCDIHNLDLVE